MFRRRSRYLFLSGPPALPSTCAHNVLETPAFSHSDVKQVCLFDGDGGEEVREKPESPEEVRASIWLVVASALPLIGSRRRHISSRCCYSYRCTRPDMHTLIRCICFCPYSKTPLHRLVLRSYPRPLLALANHMYTRRLRTNSHFWVTRRTATTTAPPPYTAPPAERQGPFTACNTLVPRVVHIFCGSWSIT